MKVEKEDVGGNYLKPKDVGDGTKDDKAIISIKGEGEEESVDFGEGSRPRLTIPVRIGEVYRLFGLSPSNKNRLIELFGGETKEWVSKDFEVRLDPCNVGKTGLQITIL